MKKPKNTKPVRRPAKDVTAHLAEVAGGEETVELVETIELCVGRSPNLLG